MVPHHDPNDVDMTLPLLVAVSEQGTAVVSPRHFPGPRYRLVALDSQSAPKLSSGQIRYELLSDHSEKEILLISCEPAKGPEKGRRELVGGQAVDPLSIVGFQSAEVLLEFLGGIDGGGVTSGDLVKCFLDGRGDLRKLL